MRWLTRDECERSYRLPDEVLEVLPEVTRYEYPQAAPQEWDCGCVAVLRVTSRCNQAFELRLAAPCDRGLEGCELGELRWASLKRSRS